MNLALFDFDGTITHTDTFTAFIKLAIPKRRRWIGRLILTPSILCYRLGLLSPSSVRQHIVRIGFTGIDHGHISTLGRQYADTTIPSLLRPDAVERLRWHQAQGDRIIIVSASLDVYLKPWCETMGVELSCAQLDCHGATLTGRYKAGDCTGVLKAQRVRAMVDLAQYPVVYAYGDTAEDEELLALADKAYFCGKERERE